jgi:hypothetical protein
VKQSWTDLNRGNCYPIDILMNNCDIGELLWENVAMAPLGLAYHFQFESSTLYFIH